MTTSGRGILRHRLLQACKIHAMTPWIDTHCHLDAPEFVPDAAAVRAQAAINNVALCVIPAVGAFNFDTVRLLAHQTGDAYALGIHPLYTPQSAETDLARLDTALTAHRDDPRPTNACRRQAGR